MQNSVAAMTNIHPHALVAMKPAVSLLRSCYSSAVDPKLTAVRRLNSPIPPELLGQASAGLFFVACVSRRSKIVAPAILVQQA